METLKTTPCDTDGRQAFSERMELEAIHFHIEMIEQYMAVTAYWAMPKKQRKDIPEPIWPGSDE